MSPNKHPNVFDQSGFSGFTDGRDLSVPSDTAKAKLAEAQGFFSFVPMLSRAFLKGFMRLLILQEHLSNFLLKFTKKEHISSNDIVEVILIY